MENPSEEHSIIEENPPFIQESFIADVLKKHGIPDIGDQIDIGPGWSSIVDRCFSLLVATGWNKKLILCRPKFGGLRIWIDDLETPRRRELIEDCEYDSDLTCWSCGATKTCTPAVFECEQCLSKAHPEDEVDGQG